MIWDTDNNGLIDSLELFAGIAIFADIKVEDKVRCIWYGYYSSFWYVWF